MSEETDSLIGPMDMIEGMLEHAVQEQVHLQLLDAVVYQLALDAGGVLEIPLDALEGDRDPSAKCNGGLAIAIVHESRIIKVTTMTPAQADAYKESLRADRH